MANLSCNSYINANVIKNPLIDIEGNLIITQGPLKKTSDKFWKMIEEYDINCIVGIVEK